LFLDALGSLNKSGKHHQKINLEQANKLHQLKQRLLQHYRKLNDR